MIEALGQLIQGQPPVADFALLDGRESGHDKPVADKNAELVSRPPSGCMRIKRGPQALRLGVLAGVSDEVLALGTAGAYGVHASRTARHLVVGPVSEPNTGPAASSSSTPTVLNPRCRVQRMFPAHQSSGWHLHADVSKTLNSAARIHPMMTALAESWFLHVCMEGCGHSASCLLLGLGAEPIGCSSLLVGHEAPGRGITLSRRQISPSLSPVGWLVLRNQFLDRSPANMLPGPLGAAIANRPPGSLRATCRLGAGPPRAASWYRRSLLSASNQAGTATSIIAVRIKSHYAIVDIFHLR